MNRPISLLYGNINPNTGLPIGALIADQNFPAPVKVSGLPQISPSDVSNFNQNVRMRSGEPIVPRPMNQVGVIAGDDPRPRLLTPDQTLSGGANTGLLGTSFSDPRTMGALNASAELLKAGGYSVGKPAPTLGQGLGLASQAFVKGYQDQQDKLAGRQQTALKNQLAMAQYMNDLQKMQLDMQKTTKDDAKTKFTQEKNLRDSFIKESKINQKALEGFNKVARSATAEPSGANDVALVFGFMKTIDPNSVVREGEFAQAQQTTGVPARILNLYNRLTEGERLTPEQRENFLQSAKQQVQQYIFNQSELEKTYTNLATSYKLDPTKVVQSKLPVAGSYLQPIQVTSLEDAEDRLKEGQFFIFNNQIGVID
tara:strand:+ start:244 stop:1350 length:1107 start_codon:yes stop_codon:yes gene_type:complete